MIPTGSVRALPAAALAFLQLAPHDLDAARFRQGADELDDTRHLVRSHALPAPGNQFVLGDPLFHARLQNDNGFDRLAAPLILHRNDACFWMAGCSYMVFSTSAGQTL